MTSKIRVFTRIKPNLNNEKEAYFSYDSKTENGLRLQINENCNEMIKFSKDFI